MSQVSFSEPLIISNLETEAIFVYASDLDNDGDADVLAGSFGDDNLVWFENTDGSGNFGPKQIIVNDDEGTTAVISVDIDNDGDMDIISASYLSDRFSWFENINGNGEFILKQVLSNTADGAISVFAANIDSDSSLDIVGASWEINQISWFENIDGAGTFGSNNIVSSSAIGVSCVYCADVDNDNDNDVIAALPEVDKVVWYENDGEGNFSNEKIITTETDNVMRVSAVDLDNDGDLDVISASSFDDKIAWYENLNGQGNFGQQNIITDQATGAFYIYSVDIDNDNDMDIVATYSNIVAWYENINSSNNFSSENIISSDVDFGHCVFSIDIDNDNDKDVLSASWGDDKIAWYRNELILSNAEKENNLMNTQLVGNFPNPFTNSTTIEYLVKDYSKVSLSIYDHLGNKVKTIVDSYQTPGINTIIWDGTDSSGKSVLAGIYYCQIQSDKNIQSIKLLLLK